MRITSTRIDGLPKKTVGDAIMADDEEVVCPLPALRKVRTKLFMFIS